MGDKAATKTLAEITQVARDNAEETRRKEGEPHPGEGWTAEAWLNQKKIAVQTLAEVLMEPLDDLNGNSAAELAFSREFGKNGSRELLVALLQQANLAEKLAAALWPKFMELANQGAASASELHQKFVDEAGGFELEYCGLKSFFGGLEAVVGSPDVKVEAGMMRDHCGCEDSREAFTTPNYKMTTTARTEWWFVYDPENGLKELRISDWPKEHPDTVQPLAAAMPRQPLPVSAFATAMSEVNNRLKEIAASPIDRTEFIGARMYTGPCFVKYNTVLRGLQSAIGFFKANYAKLCKGNKYTTTLHVINSSVVKLSKLTFASEVYRGVSGGRLPFHFRHADKYGVRGGIDPAFMSTTTDRSVALAYAGSSGGGAGVVFAMQQGMVDRGADIGWMSQYPHEKEILFAPLSGLEIRRLSVEGSVLVPEVRLSINLNAATIEEVIARRRKLLQDMGKSMAIEVSADLSGTGFEDASVRMLEEELKEKALAQDVTWYNEEENFQEGVSMVIGAKRNSLAHVKRLQWLIHRPGELEAHATPIIKLLRDSAPAVRRAALEALAHLSPTELSKHVRSVVPCIRDNDESVRSECVSTLGFVSKEALGLEAPAISSMLEHATQQPLVRRAAVMALGHLEARRLQQFAQVIVPYINNKHHLVRQAVVEALGGLPANALLPHAPLVVRALEDVDPEVRSAAVNCLGRIVPSLSDYFPAIIAKIKGRDVGVRSAALRLLGKLNPEMVVERPNILNILIEKLTDEEDEVRIVALENMANLHHSHLSTYMPHVAKTLDDHAPRVRYAAVATLGKLHVKDLAEYLPTLVRRFEDDDTAVRAAAVETLLSKLEVTDLTAYVEAIVQRIDDPDDGVRRAAALWATSKLDREQLSRHSEAIAGALDDPILSVRRAALEALAQVDVHWLNTYAPQIIQCLEDPILSVRRAAVAALAALPPADLAVHVDPLVRKVRDSEWGMRAAIVQALGTLPAEVLAAPQVFPHIIESIEDAFDGVRAAAVGVLGAMEPASLAVYGDAIARLLQHRRGAVRVAAVSILDALDPEDLAQHAAALGKLLEHPADSNRHVRLSTLQVLAKLTPEQLVPYQQSILRLTEDEDEEVQSASLEAIFAADPTGGLLPKGHSPNLMTSQNRMGSVNSLVKPSPVQLGSRRNMAMNMARSSSCASVSPSKSSNSHLLGSVGANFADQAPNPVGASTRADAPGASSEPVQLDQHTRKAAEATAVVQRLPAMESFSQAPPLTRKITQRL